MIYLVLILGFILFAVSLAYIDRYNIAFFGVLIATIVIALIGSTIQAQLEKEFSDNCVASKGLVIETRLGDLSCVGKGLKR
jgi:hypothetical protein